jgi:penicillin-binding protein 1C
MIWATRLEFRCSKEEILAMYASYAPFGGNVVGIDAAAWRYFGHSADELSWAEAATLAVLPNAPSMIHLSKGRKALLFKRNRLLYSLKIAGKIAQIDYDLALSEPLPAEPLPLPQTAPHLVSRFYKEYAGKAITSTIDGDVQQRVESIAERWNSEFRRSDIRNLAILVIDLQSNEVVAYCGNTRFNQSDADNQVDIITSPRSTGSILKPFLYYAMLNEGHILPRTLLPDIPINVNGFAPQNFNRQFEGAVPANEAVARSLNIPAVMMLRTYSVPKFYDFLKQIGITTLNYPASHYGLSLILGGAEATLWDVTSAYANMGRSLLHLPQQPCVLIKDEKTKGSKEVFHSGAVWQVFDAIKEVNRPEEIDWKMIPSMQTVAWKTGTSYGFRDAWAVGVTPRYAVGVWVGNATGEGKPGLVGARTAGPVLFDVFNSLPASPWFTRPSGEFVEAEICRRSGHLKGRFCDECDTMLILPAGLKTSVCPYHHIVNLSVDGRFRIYENCAEAESTVRKSWFTLPPVWEWYYKQYHSEYKTLPPFKPGCGEDNVQPMQFIYPQMSAKIRLPRQLDGTEGYLVAELAHSNPNATVYWHLDQTYLTQTRDFHKLSIQPKPGIHTLTAVDNEGNTVSVKFEILKRTQ